MSIPEPILVVYGELPRAIATTDLRQARVDEFFASRSLQPKSRNSYHADLRIFMDWRDLAWVDVSRRKVTRRNTFATNLIVKYELDTSLAMELTRDRDVRSF
jgi:integrase/recombinase XerD